MITLKTLMTHDEIIAVVQAHKNGKSIESRCREGSCHRWLESKDPGWNFYDYDYRVKLEPRVFWINEYQESISGNKYLGTNRFDSKEKIIEQNYKGYVRTVKFVEEIE